MVPEQLERLIERAHPAPWLRSPTSGGAGRWFTIGEAHGDGVDNSVAEARGEANANLIAGLSVVAPALIALWKAEVAYDHGVDGETRKAAWAERNAALDALADLKAG